ncbi:hypothetical protein LCGC14_0539890 [marine sediment metagenome]|uniref:FAD dependent oxidoreductase domain-containing protein n=1 Tax=marine sediment metagenome TaxID=412755 RepID=A0A0F9SBJ8_9ZZZZ
MKIAIIGAGIIGLFLSWKLSQKGNDVVIFEKNGVGENTCSGLLSDEIFNLIPGSKELVQNEIKYVRINFLKNVTKVDFSQRFCVINRSALDTLTAQLATEAGVQILTNHLIGALPDNFDRIIGCDGHSSLVRKELGLPRHKGRLAIRGSVSDEDSADFVETWSVGRGFIWKIPRGSSTEYGIIGDPACVRVILNSFLKERDIVLHQTRAKMIPDKFSINANRQMTICGDAAGFNKPWSGGGIIWGLTAATILVDTFPDFNKYVKIVRGMFSLEITLSGFIERAVSFCGNTVGCLPSKFTVDGDFMFRGTLRKSPRAVRLDKV